MTKLKRLINRFNTEIDSFALVAAVLLVGLLVVSAATRIIVPSQTGGSLVFDESYFIPQTESYIVKRYFFDIHPPLAKFFYLAGTPIYNPNADQLIDPERLANKVDNYLSPLNIEGFRLFPKVFGTLLPIMIFFCTWAVLSQIKTKYTYARWLRLGIATMIGYMAVWETSFITESRFALPSQILLFFMVATVTAAVIYFSVHAKTETIWLLLLSCLFGLAVSVKWVALSLLPVLAAIIVIKQLNGGWSRFILGKLFLQLGILIIVSSTVYFAGFAWHFAQMQNYSPAAAELAEEHQLYLQGEGESPTLLRKILEWHYLAIKYNSLVPQLDYNKPDEIGSLWLGWPIMARPIYYFWQTDGDNLYGFVYLIGNPAVWLFSLVGVSSSILLLLKNRFNQVNIVLIILLTIYFANWLPYALIQRVMYLYHYLPSLVFGMIMFAAVIFKLLIWVAQLKKSKEIIRALLVFCIPTVIMVLVGAGFLAYAPIVYSVKIDANRFRSLQLIDAWNLNWPGK